MRFTGAGVTKKEDRFPLGGALAEDPEDCAASEPWSSGRRSLPNVDMT